MRIELADTNYEQYVTGDTPAPDLAWQRMYDAVRQALLEEDSDVFLESGDVDRLAASAVDSLLARSDDGGEGWLVHNGRAFDLLEVSFNGDDDGAASWEVYTQAKDKE